MCEGANRKTCSLGSLLVITRKAVSKTHGRLLPESVSCEKSFSMKVAGALKYSVNSAVVGGGESRWKL